jgi:iron complex outermembrane receptor protein
VINIITKKPAFKRRTRITSFSGSHETYQTSFSHTLNRDRFGTRLSLEKEESDGHRSGTDFDNWGILSASTLDLPEGLLDFSGGFKEKKFGADNFYGFFPSQEETRTAFGTVKLQYEGIKGITLEPKIYYREHDDKFILIREEPNVYTNDHKNIKYGGEITCYIPLKSWGDIVFGGEMGQEEIDSDGIRKVEQKVLEVPALGEHRRRSEALYTEYRKSFKNFWINLGGRFDHNSQYGDELSPSLSLGGVLSDRFKLRLSIGRSFRAPTFTELYYQDPRKIGNPDLETERAWSYELGGDLNLKAWMRASITLFMREEDDLIDWVGLKSEPESTRIYYVKNISEVTVRGVESQLKLKIGGSTNLTGSYTFIHKDAELDGQFVSLYALDYPKHLFSFNIDQNLPYGLKGVLGGVYKKRIRNGGYFTMDLRLSKKVGGFSLFVKGTNLLNKKYEDILGAEMPGTWIMGGMEIDL